MTINSTGLPIPYVNLPEQWSQERDQLLPIIEDVLASGQYVGGKYVEEFESAAAAYCGVKHVVALNSGTDALVCGLVAMGIGRGDEVITPPNSFIASTGAIVHIGAVPVFVDVCADQNIDPLLIERAITNKTKAIMPVHLTGRMASMEAIAEIASVHRISVIEDAAQAIGSEFANKKSGSWGLVGCFSTHPLKNLNAIGDGGFLTTNDDEIAQSIRLMRSHGLADRDKAESFGFVSRMDSLQAAILGFRLMQLPEVTAKRRANANLYRSLLSSETVFIPPDLEKEFSTYHTFVIQVDRRDELKRHLAQLGISTSIHYPIPIHLQPAAKSLGHEIGDFPVTEVQASRILTLPVNQFTTEAQIDTISSAINAFLK